MNCEDFKEIPVKEIFDALVRRRFIPNNSENADIRYLYQQIDDNFERLEWLFDILGFGLKRGDGFFYLVRNDDNTSLDSKLQTAFKWIDYLDFMVAYAEAEDSFLEPDFTFFKSGIENKCNIDKNLMAKLNEIFSGQDKNLTLAEKVEKILKEFLKAGFIEEIDSVNHKYKVLTSFNYLKKLVNSVNFYDDEQQGESLK